MAAPDSPLVVKSVVVYDNNQGFVVELRRRSMTGQNYYSEDDTSWLDGVTGEFHLNLPDPASDVDGEVSLGRHSMISGDGSWFFLPVPSLQTYVVEAKVGFLCGFFLFTIFKTCSYLFAASRKLFGIAPGTC